MTTAHRPTYNSSIGRNNIYSNTSQQFSSRDLPSNLEIKQRNDLKSFKNKSELKQLLKKREREIQNSDSENEQTIKKRKIESPKKKEIPIFEQDKDFEYSDESEDEEDNKLNESSSSNNTEEELMIELEKIKKFQEEEKRIKELELAEIKNNEILKANPLLNQNKDEFSLNKKWYEDTIFKNQTRLEQKPKKRFINDTVRSDFHRKFLSKTIQ